MVNDVTNFPTRETSNQAGKKSIFFFSAIALPTIALSLSGYFAPIIGEASRNSIPGKVYLPLINSFYGSMIRDEPRTPCCVTLMPYEQNSDVFANISIVVRWQNRYAAILSCFSRRGVPKPPRSGLCAIERGTGLTYRASNAPPPPPCIFLPDLCGTLTSMRPRVPFLRHGA